VLIVLPHVANPGYQSLENTIAVFDAKGHHVTTLRAAEFGASRSSTTV
jgi:hypothetical protein